MFRSLHMKLVMILLLLITSLMTIVGAFMMTNITRFFIDEFYQQVEGVFGTGKTACGLESVLKPMYCVGIAKMIEYGS